MIEITPLRLDDRAAWQPLAVGYNAFYERTMPDATYDHVWRRLMDGKELNGLAARLDGRNSPKWLLVDCWEKSSMVTRMTSVRLLFSMMLTLSFVS